MGELYPGERDIRERGVSGGEGYPREMGIRGRGVSEGEGYPRERGIRGRGESGEEGKRNIGKGVKRRKRRRMQENKGKRCTQ